MLSRAAKHVCVILKIFCFKRAFFTTAWMKIYSYCTLFRISLITFIWNLVFGNFRFWKGTLFCTLDFCIFNFSVTTHCGVISVYILLRSYCIVIWNMWRPEIKNQLLTCRLTFSCLFLLACFAGSRLSSLTAIPCPNKWVCSQASEISNNI